MVKKAIEQSRYWWYRRQWRRAGEGRTLSHPVHIDLELVKGCDAACTYCPASKSRTRHYMNTESALEWLREARRHAYSVKLNWRGEATLHPDFKKVLDYAGRLGFVDTMLNTNGMHREALHPAITTLAFSLDSLNQGIQSALRQGTVVEKIIMHIKLAVSMRDNQIPRYPRRIRVNFTECEANKDCRTGIEKFCREHGVNIVVKREAPRNDGRIKGLRKMCPFPFQRLTVAWDGKVYPCCVPWNGDEAIEVGDLNTESLVDIWRGEKMERIRRDAKEVYYANPVCRTCTSYVSYE